MFNKKKLCLVCVSQLNSASTTFNKNFDNKKDEEKKKEESKKEKKKKANYKQILTGQMKYVPKVFFDSFKQEIM